MGTRTASAARIVLVLGLVLGVAFVVYLQSGRLQEADAWASSASSSISSDDALRSRKSDEVEPRTPAVSKAATGPSKQREAEAQSVPLASFSGPTRIEADDPYYRTESPEDAAWFNSNWFPTRDMAKAARALGSSAELPADLVPRSSWDLAQARALMGNPDRSDDALEVLERGAELGSTYALQTLGEYYELHQEFEEAQAYYLASVMRGDWRYVHRWGTGNPERDRMTMMQALAIIHRLDVARARIGMPPLTSNPRPGFGNIVDRGGSTGRQVSSSR